MDTEQLVAEIEKLFATWRPAQPVPGVAAPVQPSVAAVTAPAIVYPPLSVIDTNRNVTKIAAPLKSAGAVTVLRYISAINPAGEKTVKDAEARAIAAAGLRLGLVCEGWGDFAHGGISAGAGERDGEFCRDYLPKLGAPVSAIVVYAVDTDATAGEIAKLVIPYFRAVNAAVGGKHRIGVYGSGAVCEAVMDAGLAVLSMTACSLGWSGTRAYLAANKQGLRQHLPGTNPMLAPLHLDYDPNDVRAGVTDIGDYVPFAAAA